MSEDLVPRGRDGRALEARIAKLEADLANVTGLVAQLVEGGVDRDRLADGFAAFRAHARARELQDPPSPGKAGR